MFSKRAIDILITYFNEIGKGLNQSSRTLIQSVKLHGPDGRFLIKFSWLIISLNVMRMVEKLDMFHIKI